MVSVKRNSGILCTFSARLEAADSSRTRPLSGGKGSSFDQYNPAGTRSSLPLGSAKQQIQGLSRMKDTPGKRKEENGHKPIWSIGGGKGGTGKTFVAASLGLLFSENQVEVSLIDADLGAANLHTFLGIRNPQLSLGDFISKKVSDLSKVMPEYVASRPEVGSRLQPAPRSGQSSLPPETETAETYRGTQPPAYHHRHRRRHLFQLPRFLPHLRHRDPCRQPRSRFYREYLSVPEVRQRPNSAVQHSPTRVR